MSLEGYSDRQIIEEIERRLVDAECTHTVLYQKLTAAYALIDHVEEFIVLSAFDNDEYHFYHDYKKARDFGG